MKFINLRNYSENSILNAAIHPKDLIAKAKDMWLKSVALTDKTAYGMIVFYNACKEADMKPLYWFNAKSQWWLHNLLLFPKSEKWKINIFNILTDINTEKVDGIWKYKDNKEKLEDVIVIVDYKTFEKFPEYYTKLIDKENLYIELQPRNTKEDFEKLKEQIDINNIIVTSPIYYINDVFFRQTEMIKWDNWEEKEQEVFKMTWNDIMKIMKSIETGVWISDIEQEFEWLFFKNDEEIRKEFNYMSDEDFETILNTLKKIEEDIHFHLTLWVPQIPVFEIEGEAKKIYDENKDKSPNLNSDEWYVRYLTFSNLEARYWIKLSLDTILEFIHKEYDYELTKELSGYSIPELKKLSLDHFSDKKKEMYNQLSEDEKNIIDRAEYELIVIHKMWFDAYFLIVADYINWSKNNWDIVWPWRWSAAWSLVAYLSWITDIDPLKYDLLFERFLNSSRISLPDVDTDFSNRDAVIQYCSKKYWEDHVTPVITYGKLTAKSVLKWVWKAIWIPFAEVNRITSFITMKEQTWHVSLEKIYEQNIDFKHKIDSSSEYKRLFELAKGLEWFKQQTGQHACAVIIAPKPVTDFCPLQYPTDKKWNIKQRDRYITQSEGWDLEAQWLLKMDFLWLNNLTIMKNALDLIEKVHWKKIDLLHVDTEDQFVYENVFQNGNTTNVFQFESPWMKKYMKKLRPNTFEDLIAMVSLYRPWPMQFIDTYIWVKHWLQEAVYKDEDLKKIISKTNSVCIYQEQIMKMAQDLAGFSLWEADILRRAIWKKKKKIILEQREIFCEKGKALWKDPEILWEIYDDIVLPAAEYSFNKCLTKDTKISFADGSINTIEELLRNNELQNKKIQSLNIDNHNFELDNIVDIHKNWVKPVYEVTLNNGLKIKSTDNHNFYTINGWKELKNIWIWWEIAIPDNEIKSPIFVKIKEIKYIWEEETFDLEVKKNHNFIANGIVTHNSHAACYAFIAYQTAYLKAYYPTEYTIGTMMATGDDLERVKITLEDAQLNWITVLPPDINKSSVDYEYVWKNKMRVWLKVIKWVWEKVLNLIIEERNKFWEYKSFDDFFERNKDHIDKKLLNGLLSSGSIEDLIETNKGFANIDRILAAKKGLKKMTKGQVNLFSMFEDDIENSVWVIEYIEVDKPYTPYDKAKLEEVSIWLMLKNHPFNWIKSFIESFEQNRERIKLKELPRKWNREDNRVHLLWIAKDIRFKTGQDWKKTISFKLVGTDYILPVSVASVSTHKYTWEFKNAENQLVELDWFYSISAYWRSLFLDSDKIEFKDVNKAYKVAFAKDIYKEDDKCSWKEIFEYHNEELNYKRPVYIKIDYRLQKRENIEELKEKLADLKAFLERNLDHYWEYTIILKDDKGIKETNMVISSIERLKNYINNVSGLTIDNL